MARRTAVSFEDGIIKVVKASLNSRSLIIRSAVTLKEEEFDDFLKNEKTRIFTVVCNFKTFYQDILLIPSVAEKHFKNIIGIEIKKRATEMKEFSFFYNILGDRILEGKKMKEIFVFAVSNDDLRLITDRFQKYGKQVRCLYPAAWTLSRLVKSVYDDNEPLLCVADSGMSKILFLVKNGKLHLVRTAQSSKSDINDLDVQDINMTINYCRQTLRIAPSQVVLLGKSCYEYETVMSLMSPVICMAHAQYITAPAEIISDFITPISAILVEGKFRSSTEGNLLPSTYREQQIRQAILKYGAAFFLFFSIVGAIYIIMKKSEISVLKKNIADTRESIRNMEPNFFAYKKANSELKQLIPTIHLINRMNAVPDAALALTKMSIFGRPDLKNINISSIEIVSDIDALRIIITGEITAEKFEDIHNIYLELLDTITKTRGMKISSDKIDMKNRTFHVDIRYNQQSEGLLNGK